jgi:hypothetical protein
MHSPNGGLNGRNLSFAKFSCIMPLLFLSVTKQSVTKKIVTSTIVTIVWQFMIDRLKLSQWAVTNILRGVTFSWTLLFYGIWRRQSSLGFLATGNNGLVARSLFGYNQQPPGCWFSFLGCFTGIELLGEGMVYTQMDHITSKKNLQFRSNHKYYHTAK